MPSRRPSLPPTKLMECEFCHEPVIKMRAFRGKPYHVSCAIAVMAEYQRQMHSHSGPYWEAWLKTRGPQGRPKGGGTSLPTNPGQKAPGHLQTLCRKPTIGDAGVGWPAPVPGARVSAPALASLFSQDRRA